MKLEVGMYVKTKNGYICKIININDYREPNMKYGIEANYLRDIMFIGDNDIAKASYNIIDILEVGDYVNSEKIDYISISKDGKKRPLIRDNIYLFDKYKSINSIVTKEQFKQMAYKVGE